MWVLWETPEVRSGEKDKVLYCYEEEEEEEKRIGEVLALDKKSTDQGLYRKDGKRDLKEEGWETDYIRIEFKISRGVIIIITFLGH